jgi:hypothetical protein
MNRVAAFLCDEAPDYDPFEKEAVKQTKPGPQGETSWTDEQLSSPSADPELNQKTWEALASDVKAHTSREEWKRLGPGGYERWRRFVWKDGEINFSRRGAASSPGESES